MEGPKGEEPQFSGAALVLHAERLSFSRLAALPKIYLCQQEEERLFD